MNENIAAIVFDLGGTLRIALKDEAWMCQGRINMAALAGTDLPFEDFYALVEELYEKYREWALDVNRESNDEELWCKWLLYDYPRDRIFENRHKLSYEYRQSKGRRVVVEHGEEVLRELYRRGYKLGIISNRFGDPFTGMRPAETRCGDLSCQQQGSGDPLSANRVNRRQPGAGC